MTAPDINAPDRTSPPSGEARSLYRTVFACGTGTALEYYDFFIYGTAATLVFNKLFFPQVSPLAGTLLSLATFAVAFIVRPLGGALFGQLGDRIGRKRMLFLTMLLMGGATLAIGLLPTFDQIGLMAPILLVIVRLLQGLALGGEQAGATVMAVESAPVGRRGFVGALVMSGGAWGMLISNAVFFVLAFLPDPQFMSWGWRIPFLLSSVLVGISLFVRYRLEEAEDFEVVAELDAVRKTPLKDAVTQYWGRMLLVVLGMIGIGVNFYILSVYSISYGTTILDLPKSTILSAIIITTIFAVFLVPAFGALTDKVGRKPVFLASNVIFIIVPFLWFALLETGQYSLILLGFFLMIVGYSSGLSAYSTFFALSFPTSMRLSATAVAISVGAVAGGSVAPFVATWLEAATGGWHAVAAYMSTAAAVSLIAGLFIRELPKGMAVGMPEATDAGVISGLEDITDRVIS